MAYFVGVSVTTLVASAATTPLAAFHFQTIPTYGVLANLLAVPLTSFLVMPAGMVGMLLMPLGLEGPFFHVMTWGCEGVLATARTVAGLPGASILVTQWPGSGLALLCFGGLWLALRQQPWRWLGLVPCAMALVLIALSRSPDILIDRALDMAAVRGADGQVMLLAWHRDRLIRDSWLRSLGVATSVPAAEPGMGSHAASLRRGRLRRGDRGTARRPRPRGRGRGRGLRPARSRDFPGGAGSAREAG